MKRWLLFLTVWLAALPAQAADLKLTIWNIACLTDHPAVGHALPHDAKPKRAKDVALLRRDSGQPGAAAQYGP